MASLAHMNNNQTMSDTEPVVLYQPDGHLAKLAFESLKGAHQKKIKIKIKDLYIHYILNEASIFYFKTRYCLAAKVKQVWRTKGKH